MKILYLSWFNSGEGSQVHAREFMKAMEGLGHEIIPIELSLKSKKQLEKINQLNQKNATSSRFAFIKEFKTFLLNLLRILRLLKLSIKHRPDAIINRYLIYDFSAIIVSKLLRIPVLYEVNASAVYERKIENKYFIKWLAEPIEKAIFKYSTSVTVVSSELKKYFEQNAYDTRNTYVVPNGVDVEHYKEISSKPDYLSNIEASWHDKVVIGFLGSLKTWHGVDRVIDIMPNLLASNPNIRLLIIGDGNKREQIERKINELGLDSYVYITGFIPHKDVPAALSLIDIALAPYHNIDNFYFSPLKIFEYLAAGKPVIAPKLGQINDLIMHEENGLLLKENTQEELEAAILKLAHSPEKTKLMGDNGRKFIEENYTWMKNAQIVEKAILDKNK